MWRTAAALLCSLFLATAAAVMCDAPPACAETLSGDGQSESFGQTIVTARVEPEDKPIDPAPDTSVDRLIQSVRTGDYNTQITFLFLLLMGSALLVAERIRELK